MLQFYCIAMFLDIQCSRMCQGLGVIETCPALTREIDLCVTDSDTLLYQPRKGLSAFKKSSDGVFPAARLRR